MGSNDLWEVIRGPLGWHILAGFSFPSSLPYPASPFQFQWAFIDINSQTSRFYQISFLNLVNSAEPLVHVHVHTTWPNKNRPLLEHHQQNTQWAHLPDGHMVQPPWFLLKWEGIEFFVFFFVSDFSLQLKMLKRTLKF